MFRIKCSSDMGRKRHKKLESLARVFIGDSRRSRKAQRTQKARKRRKAFEACGEDVGARVYLSEYRLIWISVEQVI